MKTINFKKVLSVLFCIMLIAATALSQTGCKNNTLTSSSNESATVSVTELGQGSTSFEFSVFDKEGNETKFLIKTDKTIVGDALLENKLIMGDESQYGLYVKTVNGLTLDFDKDGYYWAFYCDGKYALSSVDKTEITSYNSFAFKAEKS